MDGVRVIRSKFLNVAVWGLGSHAIRNILPALSNMTELNLYGVCSRSVLIVDNEANKWNCKGWVDYNEMLNDSNVDVIYISTPIGLHYEHAYAVLKSGKHCWCEKPFTCRLSETDVLIQFSRETNLILAEGFMYMYHPQFSRVKKFVQQSERGKVKVINCRFGVPKLDKKTFRDDKLLGGGAFWDVGCYPISAVLELFPNETPKLLFARQEVNDKGLDTFGTAILKFNAGVSAILDWAVGCSYRNEIDIWSERGSLFTDKIFSKREDYEPSFILVDNNGKRETEHSKSTNHFIEMFKCFYNCIMDDEKAEKERKKIMLRAETLELISLGFFNI